MGLILFVFQKHLFLFLQMLKSIQHLAVRLHSDLLRYIPFSSANKMHSSKSRKSVFSFIISCFSLKRGGCSFFNAGGIRLVAKSMFKCSLYTLGLICGYIL